MRPRSYWQVVQDAQAVSLQVSIVAATVEVFMLLQRSSTSIASVLWSVLALVVAGQVLMRALDGVLCNAVTRVSCDLPTSHSCAC